MATTIKRKQVLDLLDKLIEIIEEKQKDGSLFNDEYTKVEVTTNSRKFFHDTLSRLEYENKNDGTSITIRRWMSEKGLTFSFYTDKSYVDFTYNFKFPYFFDKVYKKYLVLSKLVSSICKEEEAKAKSLHNKEAVEKFDQLYEKAFVDLDKIILGIEDEQE